MTFTSFTYKAKSFFKVLSITVNFLPGKHANEIEFANGIKCLGYLNECFFFFPHSIAKSSITNFLASLPI